MSRRAALVLILFCASCSLRRSASFLLISRDAGAVLIPPGVAQADLTTRSFTFPIGPRHRPCSSGGGIAIKEQKNRIVVTVDRNTVSTQPAGWLSAWTAGLESQGCLAPGGGLALAERIAQSLPLEMNTAFRLLHGTEIDLGPQTTIEVVSPVFRDGKPPGASALESIGATATGNELTVTLQSSPDLIGFETDWYGLRPNADRDGFSIVPLRAERTVQGEVEPLAAPAMNVFAFPAHAAFYRLFYKADQTEFTALAVAARTPSELEQRSRTLQSDPASCKKLNNELCIAIPKGIGVNAYIAVTVNGKQVEIPWQSTVGGAIEAAGIQDARSILARLAVRKIYRGHPVPIQFGRDSPAILNLTLAGGENITWK